MHKVWGFVLLILSFFLNIPWKWNILASLRPNYFIFIGYLKTGAGRGFERTPWTPSGFSTVQLCPDGLLYILRDRSFPKTCISFSDDQFFSHIRSVFPLFYLTYPSAHGTAARRSHASHTSIHDVIEMQKWRLGVFRIFWKSFSCQYKKRYLVVREREKKKDPLFVWGWDRKNHPSQSPLVITRQASWCKRPILGTDFSIPPSHSWWILICFANSTDPGEMPHYHVGHHCLSRYLFSGFLSSKG